MAIHQNTTLVTNHDSLKLLYLTIMAFVLAERHGFDDKFEEKHLFLVRFLLLFIHSLQLMYTLTTTLSHYSDPRRPCNAGGIVLIVVNMIIASAICVLFVLLISTIAAIIILISWIVTISIVVVLRWSDIVHQMRIIITAVANKSPFSVAPSSSSNRKPIMKERKTPGILAAIHLPYEPITYYVEKVLSAMAIQEEPGYFERFKQVNELFVALSAVVIVETSGFGDNFVEKHIFLMRLLLISVLINFLMPIVATALEHPPRSCGLWEFMLMGLSCFMCVQVVLSISTITAIITCILWIIVIFIVNAARCK